ncbi:ABC transporter ATP-binding protein [Ruegeria arenilitoris]|uniref:ABC transporter ATP-binding protein n=1 Tax=Ruegeria arenilitoris TaxID=1173585 RepID=UPI00147F0303|nr:sn-glycerol-3-phosphate ABC transporter ATP-binding protein UgpC [Ruegeria arenilitoris]
MADVKVRRLRKSFGSTEVLHGLDLDIKDGQFVVLVGPSGCGKSTLLRMIAGLESISEGEIAINDRLVNNLPPAERDIAMVFQNYALYPHKTVAANMAFPLRMRKMESSVIEDRVSRAAEVLGLTEYLGRYPRALSGGQRQRVAMGRAIVRDPQVFLFDEPLSNLDAKLRIQMRAEIRELHQRLATTTIYVTHDQIEAMTMADQIVVMNSGNIEQIGAPLELYDRPANTFVAGFIGAPSMNFLDAVVSKNGSAAVANVLGAGLPIHEPDGLVDGQKITLGIRPEDTTLSGDGVQGEIMVVEPTGSETHLVIRSDGRDYVSIVRERQAFSPGQSVSISADPSKIHLFESDTGQRIN